jgi:protein arginine N-methyltransferase 1
MPENLIAFHRKLLQAPERMQAYQRAIHATVRPGDVVLDVGCGSGILGLFACQAGAAKVYAIDRTEIVEAARQLAAANGFADRIVHLQRDVREVALDERADVLVSELISKAVLGQDMAGVLSWCRDHLLKPGARIVPADVELWVAPIEGAKIHAVAKLPPRSAYGIDFASFEQRSMQLPISSRIPAEGLLAPGQVAYRYQAASAGRSDRVDVTLRFEALRPGTLHGFGAWFSSTLAPGVTLSNHPPGIGAWDNLFFPLPEPQPVEPGLVVELRLRGRDDARMQQLWAWDTTLRSGDRTVARASQSSFLGALIPAASQAPRVTG